MKKTALATDGAVAFDSFYYRRRFDFKHYPAAMASAFVFDQLYLEVACRLTAQYYQYT